MSMPHDEYRSPEPGIAGLVVAVQQLSLAKDRAAIERVVPKAARAIARAHGATLAFRDRDRCRYVSEDGIAPLWQGSNVPLHESVSGWSMQTKAAIVVNDVYAEPELPKERFRSTFVRSFVVVPVGHEDPVAAIGAYWASKNRVEPESVELLQALADSASSAIEHVQLIEHMENLVRARTEEARRLALTDELTGLANRRGFLVRAEQARAMITRRGENGLIVFADVDGLAAVNESEGPEAGDQLLRTAAAVMADALRDMDVVGRWDGDEFVAFLPSAFDAESIRDRLTGAVERTGVSGLSLSIGTYRVPAEDPRPFEDLVALAHSAMQHERRLRPRHGASPTDPFEG